MSLGRNYADLYFNSHWRVCGLWNNALYEALGRYSVNNRFFNGAWQISPEAYPNQADTQDSRADLLLTRLGRNNAGDWSVRNNPVISFEAKGGPAPAGPGRQPWIEVRQQIEYWCDRADGIVTGQPCWAIGAIGNQVKFWIYTTSILHGGARSRMVPVTWNGNNGALNIHWAAPNWRDGNNADAGGAYVCNNADVVHIIDDMLNHIWAQNLVHPSQVGVVPPNPNAW